MKSKYIILVAFVVLVLVVATMFSQQKIGSKTKCCEQCLYGAQNDIRAIETSGVDCLHYKDSHLLDEEGNRIEILSEECITYFENNPMTVSECK